MQAPSPSRPLWARRPPGSDAGETSLLRVLGGSALACMLSLFGLFFCGRGAAHSLEAHSLVRDDDDVSEQKDSRSSQREGAAIICAGRPLEALKVNNRGRFASEDVDDARDCLVLLPVMAQCFVLLVGSWCAEVYFTQQIRQIYDGGVGTNDGAPAVDDDRPAWEFWSRNAVFLFQIPFCYVLPRYVEPPDLAMASRLRILSLHNEE